MTVRRRAPVGAWSTAGRPGLPGLVLGLLLLVLGGGVAATSPSAASTTSGRSVTSAPVSPVTAMRGARDTSETRTVRGQPSARPATASSTAGAPAAQHRRHTPEPLPSTYALLPEVRGPPVLTALDGVTASDARTTPSDPGDLGAARAPPASA